MTTSTMAAGESARHEVRTASSTVAGLGETARARTRIGGSSTSTAPAARRCVVSEAFSTVPCLAKSGPNLTFFFARLQEQEGDSMKKSKLSKAQVAESAS